MNDAQSRTIRRVRRSVNWTPGSCCMVTEGGIFVCFTDQWSMLAMARDEYALRMRRR